MLLKKKIIDTHNTVDPYGINHRFTFSTKHPVQDGRYPGVSIGRPLIDNLANERKIFIIIRHLVAASFPRAKGGHFSMPIILQFSILVYGIDLRSRDLQSIGHFFRRESSSSGQGCRNKSFFPVRSPRLPSGSQPPSSFCQASAPALGPSLLKT